MIFAIEFDGVVVRESYTEEAPVLLPGARAGLYALKRAGHTLVLTSARSNRALRFNPELNPLGPQFATDEARLEFCEHHQRRYLAMAEFVAAELPDVFDLIDDGAQGKVSADVYLDARSVAFGFGVLSNDWVKVGRRYGEFDYSDIEEDPLAAPTTER